MYGNKNYKPKTDSRARHCPGSDHVSTKSRSAGIERAVFSGAGLYAAISSGSGLSRRIASGPAVPVISPGSRAISCDNAGETPLGLLPPLAELRFDSLDGLGSVPAGADRRRTLYCPLLGSDSLAESGYTGGGKLAGCCGCGLLNSASGSLGAAVVGCVAALLVGRLGSSSASCAGAAPPPASATAASAACSVDPVGRALCCQGGSSGVAAIARAETSRLCCGCLPLPCAFFAARRPSGRKRLRPAGSCAPQGSIMSGLSLRSTDDARETTPP